MTRYFGTAIGAAAIMVAWISGLGLVQAAETAASGPPPNPLRNAYFGDMHLHTSLSFDAAAAGTHTMPEDSYKYARGDAVAYLGRTVRRNVPLDFLAVTDHSEYLGIVNAASDPSGPFKDTKWPAELAGETMRQIMGHFSLSGFLGSAKPIPEFTTEAVLESNWQIVVSAAEKYYEPGTFTTFVAYEWSSMPNGNHLHRCVIFEGPKFPARPFSSLDSPRPEDLWKFAEQNRKDGIDVILIPHNSNLSDGLMFAYKDSYGNDITRAYALERQANEPLAEVSQVKGTSETRPELSPTDEFSNFELVPLVINGKREQLEGGYIRDAYKRGLEIQSKVGVNPFKLGMVGDTDAHSGVSATEENNFPGALGENDSQKDLHRLFTENDPIMNTPDTILTPGGLTGVWAEQNTRESIFSALKRREVFATSGGRMRVRFFASFDYRKGITGGADWVQKAYAGGVPMGADLPHAARSGKPRFLVWALKDPDSANLDRIQIVKVWRKNGDSHEKIYDAVWSGARKRDSKTGKVPPVGNTVNVEKATYTNDIGAMELKGEWTDPDFDADVSAIYYARVLEIPTPRWPVYLAARSGEKLPDETPKIFQERAWTSPIFYDPR
jgi:Protein of unknown function (DUF3604)